MLFDTHVHYDDKKFDEDRDEVINRAYKSGVVNMINVASSPDSIDRTIELAEKYTFLYAGIGVHPHDAKEMSYDILEKIKKYSSHEKVVALGEMGLDYHYDFSPRELQIKWFGEQLDLAKEVNKPVIIHNRESSKDMMDILGGKTNIEGVIHCFSGSYEMAKEVLKKGFYISVGGPVTFKNAKKTVEIVKNIPRERLLIETDSPYLTPEPFRGRRNDSSYVRYVCEKIAEIWNIEFDEVANITMENAKKLFRI